MKKDYENKKIKTEETKHKSPKISTLLCIHECEMPGVGYWKAGDVIRDASVIAKIGNNPNFIKNEEGKLND